MIFILGFALGIIGGYTVGRWEKRHSRVVLELLDEARSVIKEKTTITSPSKVHYQKTALNGMADENSTSKYV